MHEQTFVCNVRTHIAEYRQYRRKIFETYKVWNLKWELMQDPLPLRLQNTVSWISGNEKSAFLAKKCCKSCSKIGFGSFDDSVNIIASKRSIIKPTVEENEFTQDFNLS